jgi:DNA-binding response OmpR family regulator
MRILLVEDDRDLLEPLQEALDASGHGVDAVDNGAIAQSLITQKDYDLLILDWLLPGVSGLQICQHYRQLGKGSPVLMLTSKDTTLDKITGLDAGADDYLVKPVDMLEFLARVRALGRRSPLWRGDTLTLADLSLHLTRLTVERGDTSVELSGREFQLMEYFMRHPEQVLTRTQIEETIWTWGEEPESNAITTLVRRLRQRLRGVSADSWIETIYGIGYRLRSPFINDCQEPIHNAQPPL